MMAAQPPQRPVSSTRSLSSTLVSNFQPCGTFFSLPPNSLRLSGVRLGSTALVYSCRTQTVPLGSRSR